MGDELTAAAIVDDARESTGLDDIGDDWFLRPLAAWADDLHGDNLTDSGRAFLRRLAVSDVARRLQVLAEIDRHPEILDVEIPPIVHITGLERSGTTLLHNLLAQHSALRPLLRWELMRPVPPPTSDTCADDPRIAQVQASIEPLRGTLLERMHWVDADDPEECVWGFIDMTGLLGQSAGLCMPAWFDVLTTSDLTQTFEDYRRVIQLLTWQHPVPTGGRLVLKAPQISRDLTTFAAVFPEAHFVVPDRDPYRTLSSMMVMGASLMDAFCIDNPVRHPSADAHDWVGTTGERLAAIARFGDDRPDRITHVPYPELARRPRATALELADVLAVPADPDFGSALDAFIDAQRAGRRVAPPERLDTFGPDRDAIWSDPDIASYCARFGIEPEHRRLTGVAPTV